MLRPRSAHHHQTIGRKFFPRNDYFPKIFINEVLIYIGFFGISDMIIKHFKIEGWELFFYYFFILILGLVGFYLLVK